MKIRKVYDTCPFCGKKWEVRCKCLKACMTCSEGHEWHTCLAHDPPRLVLLCHSDHSKGTFECSCPKVIAVSVMPGDEWSKPIVHEEPR